jgi:hypothetical protein
VNDTTDAYRIPAGLEPLAVWDTRDDAFWDGTGALLRACGAITWAGQHIPGRNEAYRIEFYLLDGPYAVVSRYALNADGLKYADPETGGATTEPPVIVPLAELPPARLLDLIPSGDAQV